MYSEVSKCILEMNTIIFNNIHRVQSGKWVQKRGNRVIFSRKRGEKEKDSTLILTCRKEFKKMLFKGILYFYSSLHSYNALFRRFPKSKRIILIIVLFTT